MRNVLAQPLWGWAKKNIISLCAIWLINSVAAAQRAAALDTESKTAKPLPISVVRLFKVRFKILYMKKTVLLGLALAVTAVISARADDAKAIYEKDCAKCHGADGKGQTKMGQKLGVKDYTDAKAQAELKDEDAMKAIKEGLKDKEGKVLMKPAENLSDSDIKGLVAYIRTFKK
jgi:cytochrome c553